MHRNSRPTILRRSGILLIAVLCLLNVRFIWGASLSGQVLDVKAGNLITLTLTSGEHRTIRLMGLAVPPEWTGMARASKRHLHMLLAGKFISVVYQTLTPKGEIFGRVFLADSDINSLMLESGLAILQLDERIPNDTLALFRRAQKKAQTKRLGLWALTKRRSSHF